MLKNAKKGQNDKKSNKISFVLRGKGGNLVSHERRIKLRIKAYVLELTWMWRINQRFECAILHT